MNIKRCLQFRRNANLQCCFTFGRDDSGEILESSGRGGKHRYIPVNHKNYNFREKKNSQAMKEGENLH